MMLFLSLFFSFLIHAVYFILFVKKRRGNESSLYSLEEMTMMMRNVSPESDVINAKKLLSLLNLKDKTG